MKENNEELLNIEDDSELSSKSIGIVTARGTQIDIASHLGCIVKSLVEYEVIPIDMLLDAVMMSIDAGLNARGGKE